MTCETEIIKYLQEHKLPTDEITYPPELIGQITIKAFEELFKCIENLRLDLEDCADDCDTLTNYLDILKEGIHKIKLITNTLKEETS